jgi:paraquat-inducible protein B
MSVRANPTSIGAFLIGAVVIIIAGFAMLASATWFQHRSTFISFFGESINGLEIGAPVKFQGVPIGTVTAVEIQIDRQGKTSQVPVEYSIDLDRLRTVRGTYVDLENPAVLNEQVADGLRVRLQMESIVTGQLYLELSYNADAKPPEFSAYVTEYPEIPTATSLLAALGIGAGSVVQDVMRVLTKVNDMLGEINMPEINAAVVSTANAMQRLVNAPELRQALAEVPVATAQMTRTMVAVERLAVTADSAIGPLGVNAERATNELAGALQALRRTLENTEGLLSTDSGIGFELQGALASLKEAADALQLLTTTLEQSPDILLRGKRPPERRP